MSTSRRLRQVAVAVVVVVVVVVVVMVDGGLTGSAWPRHGRALRMVAVMTRGEGEKSRWQC